MTTLNHPQLFDNRPNVHDLSPSRFRVLKKEVRPHSFHVSRRVEKERGISASHSFNEPRKATLREINRTFQISDRPLTCHEMSNAIVNDKEQFQQLRQALKTSQVWTDVGLSMIIREKLESCFDDMKEKKLRDGTLKEGNAGLRLRALFRRNNPQQQQQQRQRQSLSDSTSSIAQRSGSFRVRRSNSGGKTLLHEDQEDMNILEGGYCISQEDESSPVSASFTESNHSHHVRQQPSNGKWLGRMKKSKSIRKLVQPLQ